MKRLISQFFCFILIIFAAMALLTTGTLLIISSASFKIPDNKNVIVVGNSHTEFAVDDAIFLHAVNISQSGTSYLFSYIKLRKFVEVNPQINKVLLSFSGGSILKSNDRPDIISNKDILRRFPLNFSLFNMEEILLFTNRTSFYISLLKIPARNITTISKFIIKKNITYKDLSIGGYVKLKRDRLDREIELRKNSDEIQIEKEQLSYSQHEYDYLLKIIELCRKKNIELILLNTPIYNSAKYSNEQALIDFHNNHLSEIKFLDFADFAMPEYGFADISHLNYKGAEIFSRYLEDNYEAIFEN